MSLMPISSTLLGSDKASSWFNKIERKSQNSGNLCKGYVFSDHSELNSYQIII